MICIRCISYIRLYKNEIICKVIVGMYGVSIDERRYVTTRPVRFEGQAPYGRYSSAISTRCLVDGRRGHRVCIGCCGLLVLGKKIAIGRCQTFDNDRMSSVAVSNHYDNVSIIPTHESIQHFSSGYFVKAVFIEKSIILIGFFFYLFVDSLIRTKLGYISLEQPSHTFKLYNNIILTN